MKKPTQIKDYMVTGEKFTIKPYTQFDGILKTEPIPCDLESYYESEEYLSHSDKKGTLFQFLYQTIKQRNLKTKYNQIVKEHPYKGKILDYGCGVGDFLQCFQSKAWKVEGIEPNDNAAKITEEKLRKEISTDVDLSKFANESFDVITLWHVLEHIPNIELAREELNRILKPNGLLVIAVPNYESFDAKVYKEFWAAWDVPRHLWHFNKKGIQSFFNEVNFELIHTKPMWWDSFYVSWLSAKYQKSTLSLLLFPLIALLSNITALFTKNASSHTYFFKKRT